MSDDLNPYRASAIAAEVPQQNSTEPEVVVRTLQGLLQLANAQKRAIMAVGFTFLFNIFANVGYSFLGPDIPADLQAILSLSLVVIGYFLLIASLIFVFQLAKLAYDSWVIALAVDLLVFVPCLSLLALLIVNQKAMQVLAKGGYRADLFGLSEKDMNRLREDVRNHQAALQANAMERQSSVES